jgi:hypothetical protein
MPCGLYKLQALAGIEFLPASFSSITSLLYSVVNKWRFFLDVIALPSGKPLQGYSLCIIWQDAVGSFLQGSQQKSVVLCDDFEH